MLQEHWLHSRDKYRIHDDFNLFNSYTKCFDDDKFDIPIQRSRGHAGVSIMYRKTLQTIIKEIPDGGNRIIGVLIKLAKPILLLCVYLPTRGNGYSRDDYQAILDELSEIIQKYNDSYTIILGGDMNASFHRNSSNTRDIDFKLFANEHNLSLPKLCKEQDTFFHFNGKDSSQIDYFILNTDIVTSYNVLTRELCNTSTHDPITITVPMEKSIDESTNSDNKCVRKIDWNKIDTNEYERKLSHKLDSELQNLDLESLDNFIDNLCEIVTDTARELVPSKQNSGSRTRRKGRVWPPHIVDIIRKEKHCFWKWKQAGQPKSKDNKYFNELKQTKKDLRSAQRQLEASKRQDNLINIMELRETDQKQFYKLIKRQRDHNYISTSVLRYNDKIFSDSIAICETWADYFQELSTPFDNEFFDNSYKQLVEDDVKILQDLFNTNKEPLEFLSEDDVGKCIMSFKNGKAADEQGITIEHLKYGGQPVIKIIVKLVNFIFQHINLPSNLKSGICYPVFKNGGKPREMPNSYRKITVTSTIGKVVEKLHLSKNVNIIKDKQSRLQKGFTVGECPSVAALILTELKAEAKKLKKTINYNV
ncbi:Hypothetical predicted protein [Mytilus galloprovincialis]|uniref:Endonuclease/exonuclease/phosphatase domain-containing protein n=1 Tax=Mytilus galloprovincialis TaxID=29158 RepID=A0A8B6DTL6_MYTGA|nr:Hypothetical predicted protein [Mytilus galloprovincialis]